MIKRGVGTQQPLDDACDPMGPHWGTSNRQSVEHGSVDADFHRRVGKPTKESWGTLTLEGWQWSAGGRLISTGDLGYYLRDYATPSTSQKDGDTESDSEIDSENDELQTEANGLVDEEHGVFLELPSNKHQCPKCSVVYTTARILKDHLAQTHGLQDVIFRCRLCRTTFDRVHRLECHAPRCKVGGRTPSEAAYPVKRKTCARHFPMKSGRSQHERHRHPETANQRRIDATKLEAERKREKRLAAKKLEKFEVEKKRVERLAAQELEKLEAERKRETTLAVEELEKPHHKTKRKCGKATEALVLKTEWDAAAIKILLDIYCQVGKVKGLHNTSPTNGGIRYLAQAHLGEEQDKGLPVRCTGKTQTKVKRERRGPKTSRGDSAKHAKVVSKQSENCQRKETTG